MEKGSLRLSSCNFLPARPPLCPFFSRSLSLSYRHRKHIQKGSRIFHRIARTISSRNETQTRLPSGVSPGKILSRCICLALVPSSPRPVSGANTPWYGGMERDRRWRLWNTRGQRDCQAREILCPYFIPPLPSSDATWSSTTLISRDTPTSSDDDHASSRSLRSPVAISNQHDDIVCLEPTVNRADAHDVPSSTRRRVVRVSVDRSSDERQRG